MTTEQMKQKLEQAYPDGRVEVIDLTGSQDHYQVFVESQAFAGLNRIKIHQAVMAVFDAGIKSGEVHALTIKAQTPDSQ